MYGLSRSLSDLDKLEALIRLTGVDPAGLAADLRADIIAALPQGSGGRRQRDLRDAAYVIAAMLEPRRVMPLISADRLDACFQDTAGWLRPILEPQGWRWPAPALLVA